MIIVLSGAAIAGAVGAVVAWRDRRAAEAHADELVTRWWWHPARGLPAGDLRAPILGEPMLGISPAPVPVTGPVVSATVTSLPARGELDARSACPGRLVRHQDGQVECHGGRDDCWPGIGPDYTHQGQPASCAEQSHGCGSCQTAGWPS